MRVRTHSAARWSVVLFMVASMLAVIVVDSGPAEATWEEVAAVDVGTATIDPEFGFPAVALEQPLEISPADRQRLEAAQEQMHLSGPVPADSDIQAMNALVPPPPAGSETTGPLPAIVIENEAGVAASDAPRAAGDFVVYIQKHINFKRMIPSGFRSNVEEVSQAHAGRFVFATGNWWAGRSQKGGRSFVHYNPFAGPFPAHSPFCCDQVVNYDPGRDFWIWERMGIPGTDPSGNFENVFVLTIGREAFKTTSCTYTVEPTSISGAWTDEWWDYAHAQLTEDFYYISWNLFDEFGSFTRTVMLRISLDQLAACAPITIDWVQDVDWFTFVPVSGSDSRMYWASNWPSTPPQNSRLKVWRWDEQARTVTSTIKNIAAWAFTPRGSMFCGDATGNWADRGDQRVLTGTRFEYQDQAHRGRDVLAWWWQANANPPAGFVEPYVEAAAFYVDTMTQVPGIQGRPFVWSSEVCFQYPSAATNDRGDHALIFNFSSGSGDFPGIGAAIADDYMGDPPGYIFYAVKTSSVNPTDNAWGDYNTLRRNIPSGVAWTGGAHYLRKTGSCCDSADPYFFSFGRERDLAGWTRWEKR